MPATIVRGDFKRRRYTSEMITKFDETHVHPCTPYNVHDNGLEMRAENSEYFW